MVADVDRERSAARIEHDIETLAGPSYTLSDEAIRRYAYTPVYRATLDYFTAALHGLGFDVSEDPVGTLVARNRPPGEQVFGIGSHCDSNRNGGKYDGTMGVVTALEVCRLNADLGLDLPLQLVSFLEEEGSGFGQMLLGSRIMLQRVTEDELRETFRATDDGRPFWEHAAEAGYEPERWRESIHVLDDLSGWIEMHIEQARVLQDTGNRIGVVTAIAGYVHADITVEGRGRSRGRDADGLPARPGRRRRRVRSSSSERLARAAGKGTVGTVGEIEFEPGPDQRRARARALLGRHRAASTRTRSAASRATSQPSPSSPAAQRGMTARFTQRQTLAPTPMDERIVSALEAAARQTGEPFMLMPSGAAHDTMCVAERVPSAMVFVPCRDGISHSPLEDATPPMQRSRPRSS